MDLAALLGRLHDAETLVNRLEDNIAFQRQMIARLEGGGHDVRAAKMFLNRLEAQRAEHAASRDQLFKQLANRF